MRFVFFYHSLVSDWNNGNAHFLRGMLREFTARGHAATVYEPADGWSRTNLLADHGSAAERGFKAVISRSSSRFFTIRGQSISIGPWKARGGAGARMERSGIWSPQIGRHRLGRSGIICSSFTTPTTVPSLCPEDDGQLRPGRL